MRELSRLNTFLGTSLTQEQLQTVANHTTFSNMKARPTSNPTKAAVKVGRFKEGEQEFVRKGMQYLIYTRNGGVRGSFASGRGQATLVDP